MKLTEPQLAEIRARAEAATPGPWAYESVSEKSNDYCIGIVCPVDKDGNPGDPIMGNVRHHPHYFNAETGNFGEWYYEMVCSIDEDEHNGDGSLHDDAHFIAHARDDIPALLSTIEAEKKRADEAEAAREAMREDRDRQQRVCIAIMTECDALRARVAELEAQCKNYRADVSDCPPVAFLKSTMDMENEN